jgi:PAS domain S-box-containing protein
MPLRPEAPPPPNEPHAQGIFSTLFSAYPDALIVADAHGTITLANPAAESLLGYGRGELLGLAVDALVPDSIRPRHASYRDAYGRNPRPRPMGNQMELVAKRKDGSEVMVEIALSPLQSHGLPFVVAAVRDIGAYPRVRQALQRARYSEQLAQVGRIAVHTRDPKTLLERVPPIAASTLNADLAMVFLLEDDRQSFRVVSGVGLVHGEAIGAQIPNRPDSAPGFVLASGQPVLVEDYASETRFVVPKAYLDAGLKQAIAVPLSDRGRMIGALAVRSRSALALGEDEVRFLESLANLLATGLQRAHSEEALNHAQRLESVGQLTGGIAHDFNNLLTVIQGNLQVLEDLPSMAGDGHGQQLVGAAMRAARRGAELTGKLLAFSRRQVLQPTTVDLSQMIESLADMLRRTLDQRIAIEVEVSDDCPPVRADPGQLESALLNIAINARDAMPDGGRLSFRAAPADRRLPAEVRADLDNDSTSTPEFVAISVGDTGTGMSEEVRERAFEPFFTTKESGRGTGLGLSTVYGFVKQSRGGISIDSVPGHGTTLTLYLPPAPRAVEHEVGVEGVAGRVPPGLRVLLVEDDGEVRTVVRRFLDQLGCRVAESISGETALGVIESGRGIDLLLSDIALGAGMRGTELAARAQALRPQMAVLLMSGFSADLLDADQTSPPDWELLRKPYTREELGAAIARVAAAAGLTGANEG